MKLKDFKPQSKLVTKTTLVKKPKFSVVDAHNHLGDPFGGWDKKPLSELLDLLDEACITHYVDLDGGWGEDILYAHLKYFKEGAPERFQIFGGVLAAQSMPPEVPAGVPSQLLERRPDLIEAEQILVASNAREGQALADYFPRIGLTALAGSVSTELDDRLTSGTGFWSIGASAAGRLFTFGRTTYTWKATQAASDASRAAYGGTVLEALREVSDGLTAREKLVTVRTEQESAVAALRESVDISQTRYRGGLSTYLEVLDAQQQPYPAEFDLARTHRDQLLVVVRLYRALGGGWNRYEEEAPQIPAPIAP